MADPVTVPDTPQWSPERLRSIRQTQTIGAAMIVASVALAVLKADVSFCTALLGWGAGMVGWAAGVHIGGASAEKWALYRPMDVQK